MTFTPYPDQLEDLETLRQNNYTALLAIEAGGGKTWLTAMAVAQAKPEVVLIVAPDSTIKSPKKNWPVAIREVAGREVQRIGNKNKAQKRALTAFEFGVPGVYATTPQFAGRQSTDISAWHGDLLIVDESHQTATPGKQVQRRFSGYDFTDSPLSERFEMRLALSGTPMRQNFVNMWATMRLLWRHLYRRDEVAYDNFYMWAKDRMTRKEIPLEWEWVPITAEKPAPEGAITNKIDGVYCWRKDTKTATNYLAEAEPGRLVSEAPCVIIHKRREACCKHHQPVQLEDGTWTKGGFLTTKEPQVLERVVELLPSQKKAIHELEEHYMTYLDNNPLVTKLSITQQQRIRQICLGEPTVEYWFDDEGEEHSTLNFEPDCKSPFLDELLDILQNKIPEEEPVVVYLESQRFAKVLVDRLNKAGQTAAEYSGKSKADLDKFGTDYRVLVGQVDSIGTGTDGLQEKCINEVWMETPVSITSETQTHARLDRLGARGQVQRWIIKDELGYAQGRLDSNLEKRLNTNASLRKAA